MAQEIEHTQLPIRGINIHVAQVGKGELGTVVFLHGFPEIWYSWRHQMLAAAAAGYRAIVPDCRGYGLSDQPPEHEEASFDDLVADVLAILDAFSVPKAFVVGKDFGAVPAYEFALRHPDRTRGVACLGIPFSPVPFPFDTTMPEGFYIRRWGEPGRAEADFGRYDARRVVRTVYVLFSGAEVPIAEEGQEIMDLADMSTPLPAWFTEEDLDAYAALYEKSGFRYPLQMPYRSVHKMPNRLDAKFQVRGAGAHGDGGEGLLLQVPGVRGRAAWRRHGEVHAGPEDHLHPGGEPLRAGAVPPAGQRAPPRLLQGPPCRRRVKRRWDLGNNITFAAIGRLLLCCPWRIS
ncbi:unnamed protein product [Urochloa humidicola]